MARNLIILAVLAIIVALPFVFRQPAPAGDWKEGDPVLVIVSPHNEAIRYEFAQAFSKWHQAKYGKPVKIDWRNVGGTTEIIRYLGSEYTSKARGWWRGQGKEWPDMMSDQVTNRKFPKSPPKDGDAALWEAQKKVIDEFRKNDTPEVGIGVDLFFGGGQYDHYVANGMGLTVPAFSDEQLKQEPFKTLIPPKLSGEIWRTDTLYGNAISTFGIVYNLDRLRDLGVDHPPTKWMHLADPVYVRQVGLADPTKSGSIAKAFEMIVHEQMRESAHAAGYDDAQIDAFETKISAGDPNNLDDKGKPRPYPPGKVPADVPQKYQDALEQGWVRGMMLIQKIGANARYFTDSASKVPIDVSMGDAAVGMAIDFYGRYQAQTSRAPDGTERMVYVTPTGGSSVSCDPISLLRGAASRETAVRFIEFVLSVEGQRLWCYAPGVKDDSGKLIGPEKYALRRLPIRRDFYEGPDAITHAARSTDPLLDPTINPYELAKSFTYYMRWTGGHFGVQRVLVKTMCLDSADELRAAWARAIAAGKTADFSTGLPTVKLTDKKTGKTDLVELTWRNAPGILDQYDELEVIRQWTGWFRNAYERGGA